MSVNTGSVSDVLPTTPRTGTPDLNGWAGMARPYLHPTVSRLRSYTPGSSRLSSEPSAGNLSPSLSFAGPSSTPSALSRVSSHSNLHTESVVDEHGLPQPTEGPADVFKWAELRDIDRQLKAAHKSPKISNILGAPSIGLPTVLAANGLICIGTDEGKVCVFDFDQKLKCICGGDTKSVVFLRSLTNHDTDCVLAQTPVL